MLVCAGGGVTMQGQIVQRMPAKARRNGLAQAQHAARTHATNLPAMSALGLVAVAACMLLVHAKDPPLAPNNEQALLEHQTVSRPRFVH